MPDPLSHAPASSAAADPQQAVAQVRRAYDRLSEQIHKVIVGQDAVVDQILMAMFCRGHALVEGVPGLAKTLLISTIAKT
ncbi:MAG: AAA family ATPase, partial [Phycisphaerales bacterium]